MNRAEHAERLRRLMMAALDGEITEAERAELERGLEGDRTLRDEWKRMNRVKEVTEDMAFRELPEEVWEHYWGSVYNRSERGVGWILLSLGATALIGYGLWQFLESFLSDPSVPPIVRLGVFALGLGAVVLLASVAREKLFVWRRDSYRDVRR